MPSLFTTLYENGHLLFNPVLVCRRYEYAEDDDPIWDKAPSWIEILVIRAETKSIGHGTRLLEAFLKSLPSYTGIILNAIPLEGCPMSFKQLKAWYIKRGFQQISKDNISLYLIKEQS
jgi:hypothetical protein